MDTNAGLGSEKSNRVIEVLPEIQPVSRCVHVSRTGVPKGVTLGNLRDEATRRGWSPSEVEWVRSRLEEADGVGLIAIERRRQIEKWSSAHDDEHVNGELRDAGIAYAMVCDDRAADSAPGVWPFEPATFKPHETDNIENLVRAGAFIAAEIDRFLRSRDRLIEAGKRVAGNGGSDAK